MYEYDFCEYAVRKKAEGAYLAKIISVFVAAIVFAVAFFGYILPTAGAMWGLIVITAVGILIWYLSRFTAIEYEYSQTGAIFDVAAVYNKQYRREKASVDLKKSARHIGPYREGHIEGGFSPKKIFDLRSSKQIKNAYIIVYEADGGTAAILFDATKRMVENLRHQVPSVTVISDGLPD